MTNVPNEVLEIAKLLNKLEMAFRGTRSQKAFTPFSANVPSELSNTAKHFVEEGTYSIWSPETPTLLSSLWISEQMAAKKIPIKWLELFNVGYLVKPEDLKAIKKIINPKIAELKDEQRAELMSEAKNRIIADFKEAVNAKTLVEEFGLRVDMGERNSNDLLVESTIPNHLLMAAKPSDIFTQAFNHKLIDFMDLDSQKISKIYRSIIERVQIFEDRMHDLAPATKEEIQEETDAVVIEAANQYIVDRKLANQMALDI